MHPNTTKAPKHEFRVQLCRSGVIIVKHSDSTSLHELLQYAPIRPALHRVSNSNETVPNAPKHYETHQNMSLASNGVDQVHSLRKITTQLHCTNFCINCTYSAILHWVSSSNKTVPNAPKLYEMHQNMSLGSNGVDRVNSLWKLRHNFVARTFALIAPIRPVLHRVSSSTETVPNAPKHYDTHQNMSLGSNGIDRVHSLQKITTQLRCPNFWINCTYSARFAPSFK